MGCAIPTKINNTFDFEDLSQDDEESLKHINEPLSMHTLLPKEESPTLTHTPKHHDLTSTTLRSMSAQIKSCLKSKSKNCKHAPYEVQKAVSFNKVYKIVIGDKVYCVRRIKRKEHKHS